MNGNNAAEKRRHRRRRDLYWNCVAFDLSLFFLFGQLLLIWTHKQGREIGAPFLLPFFCCCFDTFRISYGSFVSWFLHFTFVCLWYLLKCAEIVECDENREKRNATSAMYMHINQSSYIHCTLVPKCFVVGISKLILPLFWLCLQLIRSTVNVIVIQCTNSYNFYSFYQKKYSRRLSK